MFQRKMHAPKRILFVCSGNACRSQIAEAWARYLGNTSIRVASAGVDVHGLDAQAVAVMAEAGIDLSQHTSKSLASFPGLPFDLIVTLSARATEHVHALPGHPPVLALPCASPKSRQTEDPRSAYRQIRDELRLTIEHLLQTWQASGLPQAVRTA